MNPFIPSLLLPFIRLLGSPVRVTVICPYLTLSKAHITSTFPSFKSPTLACFAALLITETGNGNSRQRHPHWHRTQPQQTQNSGDCSHPHYSLSQSLGLVLPVSS